MYTTLGIVSITLTLDKGYRNCYMNKYIILKYLNMSMLFLFIFPESEELWVPFAASRAHINPTHFVTNK